MKIPKEKTRSRQPPLSQTTVCISLLSRLTSCLATALYRNPYLIRQSRRQARYSKGARRTGVTSYWKLAHIMVMLMKHSSLWRVFSLQGIWLKTYIQEPTLRWKVLSEFWAWAEMMLYVRPRKQRPWRAPAISAASNTWKWKVRALLHSGFGSSQEAEICFRRPVKPSSAF
jgi:hypothetical protein